VDLTVLDAGVLIAVLNADDAHHDHARQAIAAVRDRGDRLVVPASAYAEVLVAPLRQSPGSGDAVDDFLGALPASVEAATRQIARQAAELRARHGNRLRLPDALVVATALSLEADRVVTTDARWPDLGIRVEVIGVASD
jgi:predicted nucleic acid-binding protein